MHIIRIYPVDTDLFPYINSYASDRIRGNLPIRVAICYVKRIGFG